MRPGRIRYLIVFFAAMFLANNAGASARACTVGLAAQEHTAIQVLDSSGDGHLCPDAGRGDGSPARAGISGARAILASAPWRGSVTNSFSVENGHEAKRSCGCAGPGTKRSAN